MDCQLSCSAKAITSKSSATYLKTTTPFQATAIHDQTTNPQERKMNWDNPEERASLVEQVGVTEYNKRFAAHLAASVVATVNGHTIRPVHCRFGRVFMVDGTNTGFTTQAQAEAFARTH
jgi:hypothetical protein